MQGRKELNQKIAARLLQLVKDLDVELGLERSFEIPENLLLQNRFLLGTASPP